VRQENKPFSDCIAGTCDSGFGEARPETLKVLGIDGWKKKGFSVEVKHHKYLLLSIRYYH
jgi:hypothetical protein